MLASYRTKFTCADVFEDSNGDVSSGDDSAYEGEGIVPKATSFMPDADELSGTEDMDGPGGITV